ncbi:Gfo/Idh/MocA family oxidoreductase [Halobacillus sp. A1]|uniref:Gfo/Idh/MocA family protein n=1 Tax=Halobacillus sp. A1 TaxID=2880262 RepID=UPI0020A68DB0|nr:Gfo/Idh/MocA family oxidoreductase [Halobacillus sp. A1]MCP3030965.1 Gfo/Idh/MocA family oxidoreductase [Halobacillus sp. A1]
MKWGIMSTANIAKKTLIPAIQRTEGAEVAAIASQSGKEEEAADQFNIPKAYNTYEALLEDSGVEAVYIPLPNHLHKEWTIKAARAGKHVLCEKPAALTRKDAEKMIECCAANDVHFLEAFMYQFHPQHNKVKQLIEEGRVGEVSLIRASFSFHFDRSNDNIRLDPDKGGGSLWDVGCYGVHSALNIMNEEVLNTTILGKIDPELGIDTSAAATLLLGNGVLVQIDCGFDAAARNEYQVIGTKGIITVHDAYRPDKQNHQGRITVVNENGEQSFTEFGDQYSLQVEAFMKIVEQDESFEGFHRATLQYLEVMEKLQYELTRHK